MGEGPVLGRPHRVLLGYTWCLGLATWEGGAAPGCGELQDHSPLRGPVNPQGEMGMQWLDRGVWPGRGVQAGNVTGIIAGRERKGQWEQVSHSRLRAGDCGPVGSNSEPERSGCQGLSFILLFLCKTTVSEFETPPGDFLGQCCHGFIKGPRGKTEPQHALPMSALGMNPIGAPRLTDFREPLSSGLVLLLPLTCWSEAQEPPSWLHPQGLDSGTA